VPTGDRRPKVVITDTDFPTWDLELEVLAEINADVSVLQCRTEDDVIAACADADGLLIQYAPITERVFGHLERCQVVSRYGIGVDTIDIAAGTRAGIWVCNAGDYCRTEVAEHAMALLLACSRRVVVLDRSTHRKEWNAVGVGGAIRSLPGRTLGLVGFGTIGREVAVRARAFGMRVVTSDPAITADFAASHGAELLAFDDLLGQADFISLHAPLIRQTHHLLNQQTLAKMKPTAYLINTSRGALIDQTALAEAVRAGVIAGAAIDVVEPEPIAPDDPLLSIENVIVTPHAAFYSEDSLRELQRRTALNVAVGLKGERPPWALNKPEHPRTAAKPG
jgi:D-3-phosphoglycerate dehydrogenase / 2-oxoglutarate reductase